MARSFDAGRPIRRLGLGCAGGASVLWAAVLGADAAPATGPATLPAAAAAAQPEKQKPEEAFLQSQRQQRDAARARFATLRQVGPVSAAEAARLSLERGLLRAEITALAVGAGQVRVKVEGSDATWVVSRRTTSVAFGANAPDPGPTLMLQRYEPDAKTDDAVWSIYLSANNIGLSLSGQSIAGRVMYNQNVRNPNPVTLTVTEWAAGPRMANVFTAQAATFQQLRAEHPAEFRQYLLPVLSKVSDLSWMLPDAADVYRAFADIPADPAVTQTVLALLPDLDARAFATRDAASRRLAATGRPGVLAVLRLDPAAPLTGEQRGRLGQFVAGYRHRDDLDPAAARKDPNFLADALEYPDPAVRVAARQGLE